MFMPAVFHENLFDDFFDPFWNDGALERAMNREERETFGKRGASMMKTDVKQTADGSYDGFKVDSELLQHYFTFQYVTEPDTICGDIKIVPQGSFMVCDADGDRITTYYKPVFAPNKSIKYDEKKRMLREAVEKSVEHHMMSDVPVGAFLSSGIDSAVVVALASKLQPGIKAFTAAVFGGIGSIPGALLGGLLLGIIEILGKAYVSMELGDALVFAVLIIVLLVKPTGLLGKPMREKV